MSLKNASVVGRRTGSDDELNEKRKKLSWTKKISILLGRLTRNGSVKQHHR